MGQPVSSTIDHMLRQVHREGVIVRRCGRAENRAGGGNDRCQPITGAIEFLRAGARRQGFPTLGGGQQDHRPTGLANA